MTAETIKLHLTRSAIERLFADNPELELHLRKQACREIVSKHFKELADAELWKLSHDMTESIAVEVNKVVNGFALGEREPTGRWRWYLQFPTTETVDQMIAGACEKYFSDRVAAMFEQTIKTMLLENETFDEMMERIVKRMVRAHIQNTVSAQVTELLDKHVQDAIKARSMKFKLVEEPNSGG